MKLAAAIAVLGCALASCRQPWTVRPIEANQSEDGARTFDPASFAKSIWDSKVIPAAAAAPDFAEVRNSTRPALVKGTARVLRIDAARERIVLDIAPYDGKPDAELAAGQIRGTTLRDALPFIQFSQFVNQVDYAHAANALDARAGEVASAALAGVTAGDTLSFSGVLWHPAGSELPEIVPITLLRERAK